MIRLGKMTDYAIVLMAKLTDDLENYRSPKTLSAELGLPYPTTRQLLKTLCRQRLLSSAMGPKGGYRLAHAPERISLYQIIMAFEGPVHLIECCTSSTLDCPLGASCTIMRPLTKVNEALCNVLENVSLAQLAGEIPLDINSATGNDLGE